MLINVTPLLCLFANKDRLLLPSFAAIEGKKKDKAEDSHGEEEIERRAGVARVVCDCTGIGVSSGSQYPYLQTHLLTNGPMKAAGRQESIGQQTVSVHARSPATYSWSCPPG